MYGFPEEIGKNYTQVFPYQTIAAIYSYLVIHNLGFIFLFKCASNKKKPSTFTSNRKKFIGRDIRKIIFLVGGNVMMFIYSLEILSPCAATNMSSNAKWKVFPRKSFFGGVGVEHCQYELWFCSRNSMVNVRPVVSPCIIVLVQYQTYFSITTEMSKDLLTKNQFSLRILSRHSISILYV